jgi:hypothetical protein
MVITAPAPKAKTHLTKRAAKSTILANNSFA